MKTNSNPGPRVDKDKGKQDQPARVVAKYPYVDENRNLLYLIERLDPKSFRAFRYDENGKRIDGLGETRRVLYHLPDVISADTVFICEGEKDCDNLKKIYPEPNIATTCCACGAGSWETQDKKWHISEPLAGKHIVIFVDNDKAGESYAKAIETTVSEKL
jgi:hypothetical protein